MLASIGLGELLWTTLVVFFMVVWFIILFQIIVDVFRSHDMGGGAKALWALALIIFPFVTALIYLIARGGGMAKRQAEAAQQSQAQVDAYIKNVAGGQTPAQQIAHAKELLDAGAISQAEYDQLKAKALAN